MAYKYLTSDPATAIDRTVATLSPDKVLIVTDSNVETKVLPLLRNSKVVSTSPVVVLPPGEDFKNLDSVVAVWNKLGEIGATRQSLVLNIGGGVVTDLGGFAAATFKRGISTVNFPTTLLGAVDAATGGKTGFDFRGLKNEIGAFHLPSDVIVSPLPFATLPQNEIMSGYAEMVKTAIICDREFYISLLEVDRVISDQQVLGEDVARCVSIKEDVVARDPTEKGLRKILNFGHTAGHALESLNIEQGHEITHGKAVAHGMLVALILSHIILGFNSTEIAHYNRFLKTNYGTAVINCNDIDRVLNKMNSDKKNKRYGEPLFVLLSSIGNPEIDCSPTQKQINESLELYIDMCG